MQVLLVELEFGYFGFGGVKKLESLEKNPPMVLSQKTNLQSITGQGSLRADRFKTAFIGA